MSPPTVTARLRRPLQRALAQGHPWIYREALAEFSARPGDVVTVTDTEGRFVARGLADSGALAVRVFTTLDETLGESLLAARIARAVELRERVLPARTNAYRLLHGEGDRVPGFVCDVYAGWAVLSLDGDAALTWRDRFAAILSPVLRARGVHTLVVRAGRGDQRTVSIPWGDPPEGPIEVLEHGMSLRVDLLHGQKTGAFLDQRASRARVRALAHGFRVLNLYAYTGGFSIAAGLAGAVSVDSVDIAPAALALATQSWALNALPPAQHTVHTRDVPEFLTERTRARARYDFVIADPPSFAPNEASRDAALRSYRALHTASLGLVTPGGWYLSGSCSSHVDRTAFATTLLDGAQRAHRVLQIVDAWGAPEDHPRLLGFTEGDYLKVILARVLD